MELEDYRFLIVDDHLLLRQMVSKTLTDLGASHIDMAANGAIALDKIKAATVASSPYDVVLLDWSMPNLNGLEVLTICRGDKALDKMAIIMLTAESEDINIIKALNAGATAYITKPFKPETLTTKLKDVTTWCKNAKTA